MTVVTLLIALAICLVGAVNALPSFNQTCSLAVGPIQTFGRYGQGVSGPAYGHHGYDFNTNIFFVVSNNNVTHSHTGQEGGVPNSKVLGIFPNCTVVWEYQANAPIVAGPMHDGQVIVIRTYDQVLGEGASIIINATSGTKIWSSGSKAQVVGAMNTAVHDGRVFVSTYGLLNSADDKTTMKFELTAYHAETGELLYSWSETNNTAPWDHHNTMPAPSAWTNVWMTYNPEGNKGFVGFGTRVVAFNGVTGWRIWDYEHHRANRSSSTPYWFQSFSASADGGSMWNPNVIRHLFVISFDQNRSRTCLHRFNQANGTEMGAPYCASSPVPFLGAPALNKYSHDVCVVSGVFQGSLVCLNATAMPTMKLLFKNDMATYKSTPSLAFTEKNYILGSQIVPVSSLPQTTAVQFMMLNQTTGVSAFNATATAPLFLAPAGAKDLTAVGYVELWDSSYDFALLAVGGAHAKSGAFWVGHIKK